MDRRDFDALTRLFASPHTRRTAFTAVVGAVLFGQDAQTVAAAQEVEDEHHRRRRRRRRHRPGRSGGCKGIGRFPSARRPCCPGLIIDVNGLCASPTCASCPPCQRCTTTCVVDFSQNGRCCPGGICVDGVCTPCPAGQRCSGNQCHCDGLSCPGGCCTAFGTPAGICQPGTDNRVCGSGGNLCGVCATPTPFCVGQACQACSANSCPNGCCRATTGTCEAGNEATACGTSGGVCATCSGQTPTCRGGTCVCTATSCTSGCCDGTNCQPGNSLATCGPVGGMCFRCPATATSCTGGVCV